MTPQTNTRQQEPVSFAKLDEAQENGAINPQQESGVDRDTYLAWLQEDKP